MKAILFYLFLLFHCISSAQTPVIQWQKTYGGSLNDQGISIYNTSDGGFIVAATSESFDGDISNHHSPPGTFHTADIWVIKIDSSGILEWEKSLGGTSSEEVKTIIQTDDNGFIVFGYTNSTDGDVIGLHNDSIFPTDRHDAWLVRIDSIGQILWQHCIGGTEDDIGMDMVMNIDGTIVLAVDAYSTNGDVTGAHGFWQDDYWLVKVNNNGNIVWNKTYGSNDFDLPECCTKLTDGGYIIAGASGTDFGGYHGIPGMIGNTGIVKVDSLGITEWSKCYGGTNGATPYSIIPSNNSGFFVVTENSANDGDVSNYYGGTDIWIFKADSIGTILWEKSFGGSSYDYPNKIIKSSDGGVIIAGTTASNDIWISNNHGLSDCWVVKVDSMGNFEWGKLLGGTNEEEAFSVLELPNTEILVCGYTTSNDGDVTINQGGKDVWIVKLLPPPTNVNEISFNISDFKITQAGTNFYLHFFSKKNEFVNLSIYDINGQKIIDEKTKINEGINYQSIPCGSLSSGMYFISMDGKDIFAREKVVKQ